MKDRDLISTIKNLVRGSGRSHPLPVEANTSGSREGNTTTEKKLVSGEALNHAVKWSSTEGEPGGFVIQPLVS